MYAWTGRELDAETGMQYNRARYYDSATGRWISLDPMGFDAGDSNLYRYVNNQPTDTIDPGGLFEITTLTPNVKAGTDGKYNNVKWKFALSKPAPQDGYIVQKITRTVEYTPDGGEKKTEVAVYWEAWFVKKGEIVDTDFAPDNYTDFSSFSGRPKSAGKFSTIGEIKFFFKTVTGNLGDPGANPNVPPDPATGWKSKNPDTFAGNLPSTKTEPVWWKNASDNDEGTASRSVICEWTGKNGTIVILPEAPKAKPLATAAPIRALGVIQRELEQSNPWWGWLAPDGMTWSGQLRHARP
jgi:RHS repeat-associated protein